MKHIDDLMRESSGEYSKPEDWIPKGKKKMATKKNEVEVRRVCPCWEGHWKEVKADGISLNPPKFELSCDYCGRVLETKGSGPFDHEKPGVAVGRHWEKEGEPR